MIPTTARRTVNKLESFFSRDYFLLLLLALVCYWPFSLGIFSAKNDNILVILPYRFHISEAIRSGQLPLWSPYIYLGFPLHADMQSGAWNPLVWFLSLFSRYNLSLLHIEILAYIFFSGIGMYKLVKTFCPDRRPAISAAAAYMLCGFITDSGGSNLLFLASAAFIPLVFCYYYRFIKNPGWLPSLKTVLALALLFLTGYPAFFILAAYVLLAAFLVTIFKNRNQGIWIRQFVLYHLVLAIGFLTICAPAIISYLQLLPFYQRGSSITLAQALQNSLHPASSLSLLFPTAAIKNSVSIETDLISRNLYFNSFLLVLLFVGVKTNKKNLRLFIITGIAFFFLFSLGSYTPLRGWTYHLPLMDKFRHPSNARLFVIIGCIVLASLALYDFLHEKTTKKLKPVLLAALILSLIAFAYSILLSTIFTRLDQHFRGASWRTASKQFLDQLNFSDLLLLNAILQLCFLGWFLYRLYRRPFFTQFFFTILVANSFIFAQLSMSYTFASKTAPREINKFLAGVPHGYPRPDLNRSLEQNSTSLPENYALIGLINFYNKQPGMKPEYVTPTVIASLGDLYANSYVQRTVFSYPFAYLADTVVKKYDSIALDSFKRIAFSSELSGFTGVVQGSSQLELTTFNNNEINFSCRSQSAQALCLQQVLLPGWKATINNEPVKIWRNNIAFMSVVVPAGTNQVRFSYHPGEVYVSIFVSIFALLLILAVLIFYKKPVT